MTYCPNFFFCYRCHGFSKTNIRIASFVSSLIIFFRSIVMRFFLLIFYILFFTSCLKPYHDFDWYEPPPPPDYSKTSSWAALPSIKDSADAVPAQSGLKDEQAAAVADVFFIHPTTY